MITESKDKSYVNIIDTTLRNGEQTAGVVFSKHEKIRIAKLLDEVGIPEIEIGTPSLGRPIPPGTVKTKGREDGGKLVFEFNDPVNLKMNSIVMTKHEDVRAKAQTNFEARKLTAYLTRK